MRIKGGHTTSPSFATKTLLAWAVLLLLIALAIAGITKSKFFKKQSTATEQNAEPPASYEGSKFEIDLKKDAYKKLAAKRKKALDLGLLYSSKDDLVDANIRIDGKTYACKLRLKGDLMDHLRGNRWSFRIILKDNKEWRGMNTFNVHNSQSRAHTAEWVMHKIFEDEGIMFPEYDFIEVSLNGKDLGVYAYEHHFEDQLLKKNGRELGPILKHNDDAYWENVNEKLEPFPWIEASYIELFNKAKSKDPEFKAAFDQAHGILTAFLDEKKTASEVFDIDLTAKYYALLDLTHAWHAQSFTNIRFYMNPMTGKLEPIAYDCFGEHLEKVTPGWDALGQAMNSLSPKRKSYDRGNVYRWLLFRDKAFFKKYMQYLEKYTAPDNLQKIIAKHGQGRDSRVNYIKSDPLFKNFKPNWNDLFVKGKYTYKKIQPRPNLTLKALRVQGSKQEVDVQAFHYFPLELVGFGNENYMTDTLTEPLTLEAYNHNLPVTTYRYKHNKEIEYLYFRTLGLEQLHRAPLLNVSSPPPVNQLASTTATEIAQVPYLTKIGRDVVISAGRHSVFQNIVIPEDSRLVISAGADLNFTKGGKILSYGPVLAIGSRNNPIKFHAEDNTNTGIFVSGSAEISNFEYCYFDGLSQYKQGNITVESGISFYKTKARMENCSLTNSPAKVALNCNYSELELRKVKIIKCQGTAIESKYSSLKLTEVDMEQIGKNGITQSSGTLNSLNLRISSVLNSALRFTDNAQAYLYTVFVNDSRQSLFANKHSTVKLINFQNRNIERGIELRTASEPATKVEIEKLLTEEVKQIFLLKDGVDLTVDGKAQTAL